MADLAWQAVKTGWKVVHLLGKFKANDKDADKIQKLIHLVTNVCMEAAGSSPKVSCTETDPKVSSALGNLRDVLEEAEREVTRCQEKKKIIKAIKVDEIANQLRRLRDDIKDAMAVSVYETVGETKNDVKDLHLKLDQALVSSKKDLQVAKLESQVAKLYNILCADLKETKKLQQERGENNDTVDKQQKLVLTRNQLRERQREITEWISQALDIPYGAASVLLLYSNWDPKCVIDGWFDDGETLRQAVGLPLSSGDVSGPDEKKKRECDNCDKDTKRMMISASCSHYCCKRCWRKYIRKAVSTGIQECLSLRCPNPSCGSAVIQELLDMAKVNDKVRESYADFLLQSYVDHSGGKIKWCPSPDCDLAIELLRGDKYMVVACDMNHSFCWICLKEPHGPLSCDGARLRPYALENKKAIASSPLQEMDALKSSELRNSELKFLWKADEEIFKFQTQIELLNDYRYEYLGQLKHEGDKCKCFDMLRDEAYESLRDLKLLTEQEMMNLYPNRVQIDASFKERKAFTKACKESKTKVMVATKDARDKVDNLVKAVQTDFEVYSPE